MTRIPQIIPDAYIDREQALVKHKLLEAYLEKMILIIGMSAKRERSVEIGYVDCFAGPWGDESESMAGTSIAISLQTMDSCRNKLADMGVQANIRALYIEKSPRAFNRLNAYLQSSTPEGINSNCLQGSFLDLRDDILTWCGNQAFVFFFIDPKGWKDVGVDQLRPLLQRPRSEFLINFIYDFINRTAAMASWETDIAAFLGTTRETVQAFDGQLPHERERLLLTSYREGLKSRVPSPAKNEYRPRTGYVRVMDPSKERPKYHLIYLTSHPKGLIEFMEISQGVDLIQKQIRATKKFDKREADSGVRDMFSDEPATNTESVTVDETAVDAYWVRLLSSGMQAIGQTAFADILEETDWLPDTLQTSLSRLIATGQVINLDSKTKRPKRPLHFEKTERLQLTVAHSG
ncbi:MAG: three-Cys-motif partner protein TcmP [Rhodoferax sp.]|uniref:three-Cys-motif partner protein TcmP n=1 Tax=Rhodoferax sp. TaxID=50421 RepID=UPI00260FB029|nr:three-Cys-motif partner protein TcmP [Rhodoferax sp.]MDD2883163.1 three-Cys-motif partner protein TcmP [Rhodoferax sp.]